MPAGVGCRIEGLSFGGSVRRRLQLLIARGANGHTARLCGGGRRGCLEVGPPHVLEGIQSSPASAALCCTRRGDRDALEQTVDRARFGQGHKLGIGGLTRLGLLVTTSRGPKVKRVTAARGPGFEQAHQRLANKLLNLPKHAALMQRVANAHLCQVSVPETIQVEPLAGPCLQACQQPLREASVRQEPDDINRSQCRSRSWWQAQNLANQRIAHNAGMLASSTRIRIRASACLRHGRYAGKLLRGIGPSCPGHRQRCMDNVKRTVGCNGMPVRGARVLTGASCLGQWRRGML
mmetsp:Transcript_74898/g.242124  ORF Transcript_74898/g.242124 Transcript_74898/m.242124 type:complete len:292 (-) Transcript_74898:127-1002(-)